LDEYIRRENLIGKTGLNTGQTRRCRFTDRITEKPRPGEEIINRFHPVIRFFSIKAEDGKAAFPLYAARIASSNIEAGRYALITRLASFSGVKEDEHLLVTAVPLHGDSAIPDRDAELLLDLARISGVDWPAAAVQIDAHAGVAAIELCEDLIRERYRALKEEKVRENRDRADVLTQLLDDHVRKKREGFERRIANHELHSSNCPNGKDGKRRKGLANAERKKLADFLASMETRREVLARKSKAFRAEIRDVCLLFVDVVRGEGIS
jgi:hypothetical protein